MGASAARRSWPWAWLALAAAAPVLATIWWQGSVWTLDHLFWVDLALGPAVACLLAGLATGRPAPLLRLLDTRPLRSLGSSSYSLYLTHGPIVVVVYEQVVAGRVGQGVPAFVVSLALVVPLTIVFARVFASVFETPFRSAAASAPASVRPEPRRERVAQQHHVADLAHLGERRAPVRVPREARRRSRTAGRCESPTKNGATTSCSSSTRSSVRNWVCTVPPPSTISRSTPRAARSSLSRRISHAAAAVDDRRHRPEPRAGVGHPRARRSRRASRRRRW